MLKLKNQIIDQKVTFAKWEIIDRELEKEINKKLANVTLADAAERKWPRESALVDIDTLLKIVTLDNGLVFAVPVSENGQTNFLGKRQLETRFSGTKRQEINSIYGRGYAEDSEGHSLDLGDGIKLNLITEYNIPTNAQTIVSSMSKKYTDSGIVSSLSYYIQTDGNEISLASFSYKSDISIKVSFYDENGVIVVNRRTGETVFDWPVVKLEIKDIKPDKNNHNSVFSVSIMVITDEELSGLRYGTNEIFNLPDSYSEKITKFRLINFYYDEDGKETMLETTNQPSSNDNPLGWENKIAEQIKDRCKTSTEIGLVGELIYGPIIEQIIDNGQFCIDINKTIMRILEAVKNSKALVLTKNGISMIDE